MGSLMLQSYVWAMHGDFLAQNTVGKVGEMMVTLQ